MGNIKENLKCSSVQCSKFRRKPGSLYCEAHYYQMRRNGFITNKIVQAKEFHGLSKTPEFTAWAAMKGRCSNKKNKRYKYYGGRGIKVCKRWDSFKNFLCDMGLKPSSAHSLDRIDVNSDYSPTNCRWVTADIHSQNRRTVKLTMDIAEEIRELSRQGQSSRTISIKYQLSQEHTRKIIRGACWKRKRP